MLTNKDKKNNLRILQRAIKTRVWEDSNAPCRICGLGRDTISHLATCQPIRQIFSVFEDSPSPELIYLGIRANHLPLTGLDSVLYTLLRKFILIAYTRVDTDNATFSVEQISKAAAARASTRIEAYIRDFRDMLQTHRSRGEEPPHHKVRNYQRYVEPYLRLHPTGKIEYAEPLRDALNSIRTYQIPGKGFQLQKEEDRQYPHTYHAQPPPNPWARVIYESIIPAERKPLDAVREANTRSARAQRRKRER
jgi:hypothetical protein|eukprot:7213968-Prymnesium_polylepis.2